MGLEYRPSVQGREAITVVVGQFEPFFDRGLTDGLRKAPSLSVLEESLTNADLERIVVQRAPRVAILNGRAGKPYLLRLARRQPATGLMVLVQSPTRRFVDELLTAGVSCLPLSVEPADLLDAIRAIADGTRISRSIDGHEVRRRYPADAARLTRREREVFGRLSGGERYGEIARALKIGKETVRTHAKNVRRKLSIATNDELIGMPGPPRS